MSVRYACFFAASALFCMAGASADEGQLIEVGVIEVPETETEDIVRLPGQGEIKATLVSPHQPNQRLKPGGGLMMSFDADQNGRITRAEVASGVARAFAEADSNNDGELTALEQQDWAAGLPTRDDTLANPARFDPNLDRIVHEDEFADVIINLAADYAEEGTDEIILANLESTTRQGRRDEADIEERRRHERERREKERNRQRW